MFWSAGEKDIAGVYKYLNKAAEVNKSSPEFYLATASADIMIEWDFENAIINFRHLLELNPNHAEALEAVAGLYIMVGEFDEAMIHIDRALEINPLSLNHTFMKGNIWYFAGEYEKAIQQMNKVLKQDPEWMFAIQLKAASLILLTRENEFINLVDRYAHYPVMNYYRTLYKLYHDKKVENYEVPSPAEETIHAWNLYFDTLDGYYDEAFSLLESGLQNKEGRYYCYNHDPFLEKLRKQTRFYDLPKAIPEKLPKLSKVYRTVSEPRPLISSEEERVSLGKSLDRIMKEEQMYLDAELSLSSLADNLTTSSNKLSWLINEDKEMNFNDYINSHRLEHFKKLALDPASKNLTLLGIAFESGFNSKSTFNDYFKKKTGITPRGWLKQQQS